MTTRENYENLKTRGEWISKEDFIFKRRKERNAEKCKNKQIYSLDEFEKRQKFRD